MDRRDFLKKSFSAGAGAAAVPLLLGGLPLRAFGANSPFGRSLTQSSSDNILVLVQLSGGNDGLNTIIPYQDPLYAQYRPKIGVTSPLDSTHPFGYVPISPGSESAFNGQMTTNVTPGLTDNFYSMYQNGELLIIQGVTYPNPSLSHFVGINNWMTGMDGATQPPLQTGWLGRYLQDYDPTFLQQIQNGATDLDPLAVQIGYSLAPVFQGPTGGMGIAISSPTAFENLVGKNGGAAYSDPSPAGFGGNELTFVQTIIDEANIFATQIKAAASNGKNASGVAYPSDPHLFAAQLKIVAQLISGGLKTKIYMVYIGGFDTHANQNNAGGQPDLLQYVSEGIAAFIDDLKAQQLDSRVLGMTFSEFGRRVKDNGSGTDHGTAAPMFLFGTPVNGGIIGTNPSLSNLDPNGNLLMQYDYRQVYSSVLDTWLGADSTELSDALNGRSFTSLPVVKNSSGVNQSAALAAGFALYQNYPNPFRNATTIEYAVDSYKDVSLKIFAENGRAVATLVNAPKHYGRYRVSFRANGLPSGNYIARLQAGNDVQTKVMQIVQ